MYSDQHRIGESRTAFDRDNFGRRVEAELGRESH